jgi:hypothetical protein
MTGDDDAPRSVLEILNKHGAMSSTTLRSELGVAATSDELRKPRDPKAIRKWLNVRRKKVTRKEEALIWRKLCELYRIPEEWPLDVRHYLLAGFLSAELFKRCAALWKPHGGGPSKQYQQKMKELKANLRNEFDAFRQQHRSLSWQGAAALFLKKNKEACETAGFTSPKAFAQAMKQISSGTLRA